MFRLKELRKQKKYNQERLAMELNVSQATISAYETGECTPDLEMLIRIANYFNVSVDYLVGNSDILKTLSSDLTQDEIEHSRLYQKLNYYQKQKANAYIQGLLD